MKIKISNDKIITIRNRKSKLNLIYTITIKMTK